MPIVLGSSIVSVDTICARESVGRSEGGGGWVGVSEGGGGGEVRALKVVERNAIFGQ